jgi:ornithine carbamoyltransferase
MTFEEIKGSIQGKKISWVGDGNNVTNSLMEAATQFDFELKIACPKRLYAIKKSY